MILTRTGSRVARVHSGTGTLFVYLFAYLLPPG